MIVKTDSREQEPLPFKVTGNVHKLVTIGLPFGDYWCTLQNKDGSEGQDIPIVFERKSMADLYGTLSSEDGIRRHKEKIRKAKEMNCALFLIIEGSLTDAYKGVKYSKVEPHSLVKRVYTFWVKYDLPAIFCISREEMMKTMIELWEAWARNYDHLPTNLNKTKAVETESQ